MTDELQHPADHKHGERGPPQALNEEARHTHQDRNHDQRNPKGVAEPVDRMLVTGRVLRDPLRHGAIAEHGPLYIYNSAVSVSLGSSRLLASGQLKGRKV